MSAIAWNAVRDGNGITVRHQWNAQFQYIAVFYNRRRRHSTLGYLSPTTFLQNWIERQDQQEMAA